MGGGGCHLKTQALYSSQRNHQICHAGPTLHHHSEAGRQQPPLHLAVCSPIYCRLHLTHLPHLGIYLAPGDTGVSALDSDGIGVFTPIKCDKTAAHRG